MQCLAINSCYISCPFFVFSFQDSYMYTRPLDIIPEVLKALCLKIFFFLFFRLYNFYYFIFRFSCSFLCCLQCTMQWVVLVQIFYFQFHISLVIFSSCFFSDNSLILFEYIFLYFVRGDTDFIKCCWFQPQDHWSIGLHYLLETSLCFLVFLRLSCFRHILYIVNVTL